MIANNLTQFFEGALFKSLGKDAKVSEFFYTSGGCINNTARIATENDQFFIKWNESVQEEFFAAEARGLNYIKKSHTLNVPGVIGCGTYDSKSFLILEYVESVPKRKNYWEELGLKLAQLHKVRSNAYGLEHANFIGSLPQANDFHDKWVDFFINQRLEPQISLAKYKGLIADSFLKKFRNIYSRLYDLLPEEYPSLLHGDLWSGNVMAGPDGYAWLIDPAVYFGHREAEIAFTRLFGGFDEKFYFSYQENLPLLPGFHERVELYNLYPLLVHVNLFGLSYKSPVERTINKLQ